MMAKGCGVTFWCNENVLKLIVAMDAQVCEYTKTTVHFKWANCMVRELSLNKAVLLK